MVQSLQFVRLSVWGECMNNRIGTLLLIGLLACAGCSEPVSTVKPGFITVSGTGFFLDGKPYRFAGANLWYGAWLGQESPAGNRDRLIRELDLLSANGMTNLRILASAEAASHQKSVKPVFQPAAGVFNDSLAIGLDFLLSEMGKRNMKAVLYLTNYWEWSGGMAVYNEWTGAGNMPDPSLGDWRGFMNFSAGFYSNPQAQQLYRATIDRLVGRVNSITGLPYKDDPVIMAWQLANEPRPGTDQDGSVNVPSYVKWIDETARYIKTLDPNHLVSTGSEGTVGSILREDVFLDAHDSPAIDYATLHLWAKNWGWYKKDSMETTFPRTRERAADYINSHIAMARKLNKPLVLEEFGLGRDGELTGLGTPVTYRDQYFYFIFNLIEDSLETGSPLAGTNIWAWGGVASATRPDAIWKPGDPFVGDPPQEPQGLNSVFAGDESTLQLILNHSKRLESFPRQR